MHELVSDLRYAVRILAKAPGFAIAAILTLALGIGANIAMFSIVYGVLLRPLPYRDADRLVVVCAEVDYVGVRRPVPISIQTNELKAWQRPFDSIAAIALFTGTGDVVALSGENGSEVLSSATVSGTFFSTMAGPFAAGRPLQPADSDAPVVVISERLARRLFGSPDRAVNRQLSLTRGTCTVIGVADPAFQFPSPDTDVWLPAGFVRSVSPRCCGFQVIARLEPNGTVERAFRLCRCD